MRTIRGLGLTSIRKAIRARLSSFGASREGVGAVEFALIVPILLIIYLMSFEVTIGISTSRKVSHAASDIADLVTQQTTVSKTYLGTMSNVAQAVLAPYTPSSMTLKVTGISIDASSNATVLWSWSNSGSRPYTFGSAITVPNDLKIANSFLVHSELSIPYSLLLYLPGLNGTETKSFNISKDYYYRQRVGSSVTCSDC